MQCLRAICTKYTHIAHSRDLVHSLSIPLCYSLSFQYISVKYLFNAFIDTQTYYYVHRMCLPCIVCTEMGCGVLCCAVRNAIILLLLSLSTRISCMHFSKNLEFFSIEIEEKKNRYVRMCVHAFVCACICVIIIHVSCTPNLNRHC